MARLKGAPRVVTALVGILVIAAATAPRGTRAALAYLEEVSPATAPPPFSRFGSATAIWGDYLVVGEPLFESGAVYLYAVSAATGSYDLIQQV